MFFSLYPSLLRKLPTCCFIYVGFQLRSHILAFPTVTNLLWFILDRLHPCFTLKAQPSSHVFNWPVLFVAFPCAFISGSNFSCPTYVKNAPLRINVLHPHSRLSNGALECVLCHCGTHELRTAIFLGSVASVGMLLHVPASALPSAVDRSEGVERGRRGGVEECGTLLALLYTPRVVRVLIKLQR